MANIDIFVLANDWPSWAPVSSSSHLLWAVVSTSALKPFRRCAGLSCSVPCGCHSEGSGHWSVLWLISQGGWKAGVGPVCVQLGSDQESINDRVIAFLRAPSAVFLVTSGSLVFLYLASRSESWALIYRALSEPRARRTVRGDSWGFAASSGPGEEGAPVLWSLRPLQPPGHCDCSRKASRQECKEAEKKKAQGGFPTLSASQESPFVLLKPERGAPGPSLSLPMAQLRFQATWRDQARGTGFVGSCNLVFFPSSPITIYFLSPQGAPPCIPSMRYSCCQWR